MRKFLTALMRQSRRHASSTQRPVRAWTHAGGVSLRRNVPRLVVRTVATYVASLRGRPIRSLTGASRRQPLPVTVKDEPRLTVVGETSTVGLAVVLDAGPAPSTRLAVRAAAATTGRAGRRRFMLRPYATRRGRPSVDPRRSKGALCGSSRPPANAPRCRRAPGSVLHGAWRRIAWRLHRTAASRGAGR